MRKLLFESLFRRPFTEQAPSSDDAAVTELVAAVGRARGGASAEVSPYAKSTLDPAMDAARNPRVEQRLLRCRALRSPVRCVAAPCRCVDGDRSGDEEHARRVGAHLSCDPQPEMGRRRGDCARDGGCFAGSYAVVGGVSQVVPVDLHIPGCPPPPTRILQGLLLCSIKRPKVSLPVEDLGTTSTIPSRPYRGGVQAGIVLVMTPLVIFFAQYRDDDFNAPSRGQRPPRRPSASSQMPSGSIPSKFAKTFRWRNAPSPSILNARSRFPSVSVTSKSMRTCDCQSVRMCDVVGNRSDSAIRRCQKNPSRREAVGSGGIRVERPHIGVSIASYGQIP